MSVAMMQWGDAEIRVAADGSSMSLFRDEQLVVDLSWVGAVGHEPELVDDDEVEHALHTPVAQLLQRAAINDGWRSRWVLVAEDAAAMTLNERIRVAPGPEYSLWSWGSGVTAVLMVGPAHAAGPVLGLRLEQGYLELAAEPTPGNSAAEYRVAPRGAGLGPGERLVTVLAAQWFDGWGQLVQKLPPWVGDTQLDLGEPWPARIADYGIKTPDGVKVDYLDGVVAISGPAGRSTVDLYTPRGLSRIDLEWVPSLIEVLHSFANQAFRDSAALSAAAAFCVQSAVDRSLLWLDDAGQDRLDQVDWAADGSVLAAAFALARGRSLGEGALVSDGLRLLARQAVGIGYGRVVMAGYLAAVATGIEAQERCLELLGRPAVGRTAALESSLLHYRSADFGQAELAGVANRLGGLLPGVAPLLSWTEIAQLTGLVELCPSEWDGAGDYADIAEKIRSQVLCAYADGRIVEAEPLAWLLLSPGISPAS